MTAAASALADRCSWRAPTVPPIAPKYGLPWSGHREPYDKEVLASASSLLGDSLFTRADISLRSYDNAVRAAYEHKDPLEALFGISRLWSRLDKSYDLTEARTRILLGKVTPPEQWGQIPPWLTEQLPDLATSDEGSAPSHPIAIMTAVRLVQACLNKADVAAVIDPETDSDHQAEVYKGPMGRVIVDWTLPRGRLQWMVEAADLPWPGVKVHVMSRVGVGPGAPRHTRTVHNAFEIVEQFREHLDR